MYRLQKRLLIKCNKAMPYACDDDGVDDGRLNQNCCLNDDDGGDVFQAALYESYLNKTQKILAFVLLFLN